MEFKFLSKHHWGQKAEGVNEQSQIETGLSFNKLQDISDSQAVGVPANSWTLRYPVIIPTSASSCTLLLISSQEKEPVEIQHSQALIGTEARFLLTERMPLI